MSETVRYLGYLLFLAPVLAGAAPSASAADAPRLDAEKIAKAAGTKATTAKDGVVRIAWARTDVAVTAEGGVSLPVTSIREVPGSRGHSFDITFQPSAQGGYRLVIEPDVRDVFGNLMDQNDNGVNGQTPGDRSVAVSTTRAARPGAGRGRSVSSLDRAMAATWFHFAVTGFLATSTCTLVASIASSVPSILSPLRR